MQDAITASAFFTWHAVNEQEGGNSSTSHQDLLLGESSAKVRHVVSGRTDSWPFSPALLLCKYWVGSFVTLYPLLLAVYYVRLLVSSLERIRGVCTCLEESYDKKKNPQESLSVCEHLQGNSVRSISPRCDI